MKKLLVLLIMMLSIGIFGNVNHQATHAGKHVEIYKKANNKLIF